MDLTRRNFVQLAGGTLTVAALRPLLRAADQLISGDRPNPAFRPLVDAALATARKLGASYADIRISRVREQSIAVRSLARDKGANHVPEVEDSEKFGFGVRVLVNGAWGFAASHDVTSDEAVRVSRIAVRVARANAVCGSAPIELVPVPSRIDVYRTPFRKDPFAVTMREKLSLLRDANESGLGTGKIVQSHCDLMIRGEQKWFGSSEGSYIEQYIQQVAPTLSCAAADARSGTRRMRRYSGPAVTGGWEDVENADLREHALRAAEEAEEMLRAPAVEPGKKDLVLLTSNLALTVHETIAHPTELDRVLGYEANWAGTSYLSVDKLKTFRIGSELVNVVGDRTLNRGLATCGYDDDGVKTMQFDIVRDGILVGFQTTRDQARLVGDTQSHACCYADGYASVPFQRIPNVWLKPAPQPTTVDDLISGVDDGLVVDGRASWSIDQQRLNFQFSGDALWEIKHGKKTHMISRAAYQGRTPEFWSTCDGIADSRYWANEGLLGDGKGQPEQMNNISHGCAPARFRGVNVVLTA